jgi:hypothetical protein
LGRYNLPKDILLISLIENKHWLIRDRLWYIFLSWQKWFDFTFLEINFNLILSVFNPS